MIVEGTPSGEGRFLVRVKADLTAVNGWVEGSGGCCILVGVGVVEGRARGKLQWLTGGGGSKGGWVRRARCEQLQPTTASLPRCTVPFLRAVGKFQGYKHGDSTDVLESWDEIMPPSPSERVRLLSRGARALGQVMMLIGIGP